jgi:hypothetical protein
LFESDFAANSKGKQAIGIYQLVGAGRMQQLPLANCAGQPFSLP